MIISMNDDADKLVLQIYVDPSNRNGWQKEPYRSDILKLAKDGNGKYQTEIRLSNPDDTIHVK